MSYIPQESINSKAIRDCSLSNDHSDLHIHIKLPENCVLYAKKYRQYSPSVHVQLPITRYTYALRQKCVCCTNNACPHMNDIPTKQSYHTESNAMPWIFTNVYAISICYILIYQVTLTEMFCSDSIICFFSNWYIEWNVVVACLICPTNFYSCVFMCYCVCVCVSI